MLRSPQSQEIAIGGHFASVGGHFCFVRAKSQIKFVRRTLVLRPRHSHKLLVALGTKLRSAVTYASLRPVANKHRSAVTCISVTPVAKYFVAPGSKTLRWVVNRAAVTSVTRNCDRRTLCFSRRSFLLRSGNRKNTSVGGKLFIGHASRKVICRARRENSSVGS